MNYKHTFLGVIVKVGLFVGTMTAQSVTATEHSIKFMPPGSNTLQQGFVRVTNKTATTANVSIIAVDDNGSSSLNPVTVSLAAYETKGFTVADLESGNTTKGLFGSLGTGVGDWRLFFDSSSTIAVTGYIRSPNGFLASVHEEVGSYYQGTYHWIETFNPGKNQNQQSKLRLINNSSTNNTFTIIAKDDSGALASGGTLNVTLAAYEAITFTSAELENGKPGSRLIGALGTGQGKWRFTISSTTASSVINLMEVPGGYLSNLSTVTRDWSSLARKTLDCADLNGASVFSTEPIPVFLGFFGSSTSEGSINNLNGVYGSSGSALSVRNAFSKYAITNGKYSINNNDATASPPIIVKEGDTLGYLSLKTAKDKTDGYVSLSIIDKSCTSSFNRTVAANPFQPYGYESVPD